METVGQFFFSVLPMSSPPSNQNKNYSFGRANRSCCLPTPTDPTFCHFRIDFNSFIPRIFAFPLCIDSVLFAEISFASHMNEVLGLALVAEFTKLENKKIKRGTVGE